MCILYDMVQSGVGSLLVVDPAPYPPPCREVGTSRHGGGWDDQGCVVRLHQFSPASALGYPSFPMFPFAGL